MKKVLLIILLVLAFSCNPNITYPVHGVILEINKNNNTMLIDHDEIKGFMDPMIMTFKIHDSVNINNFTILDSVKFDIVITDNSHYSLNFKKLGKGTSSVNQDDIFSNTEDIYSEVKIGDKLHDVSFLNSNNDIYNLSDFKSELKVISFIFSRCPMPEMCPATISKKQNIAKDYLNNNDVEFSFISFDYIFDTPEILKDKYDKIIKNYNNIHFLSSVGHKNDLFLITKQSGVSFGGIEENNIGHTMRTIVIDKDLKLLKVYKGMNWKPSELKKDLISFLNLLN